jgi:RNA polymerase sigma-70 factor (ECF subfamily)
METAGEIAVRERPGVTDDEDARLWAAVAEGDDAAFETLVMRHGAKVASVAARLLRDPNDVEDVVQETFVRAYATRQRYPGRDCVRAWLLRIAINLCKSRRRAPWWRRVWLTEDAQALGVGSADPAALAEASLMQREVLEAVRRLPERLRQPFLLRYFEDLPGSEIAAVLGCNESTVWTRIYAARRELKKCLGEEKGVR